MERRCRFRAQRPREPQLLGVEPEYGGMNRQLGFSLLSGSLLLTEPGVALAQEVHLSAWRAAGEQRSEIGLLLGLTFRERDSVTSPQLRGVDPSVSECESALAQRCEPRTSPPAVDRLHGSVDVGDEVALARDEYERRTSPRVSGSVWPIPAKQEATATRYRKKGRGRESVATDVDSLLGLPDGLAQDPDGLRDVAESQVSQELGRVRPLIGELFLRAEKRFVAAQRRAQLDNASARDRWAGLLPDVSVRVGYNTDQTLRLTPVVGEDDRWQSTGGADSRLELRAGWDLHRLIYGGSELSVERLHAQFQRDWQREEQRISVLLETWMVARVEARVEEALLKRMRALARAAAASAALDRATGGWFSRAVGRIDTRGERDRTSPSAQPTAPASGSTLRPAGLQPTLARGQRNG